MLSASASVSKRSLPRLHKGSRVIGDLKRNAFDYQAVANMLSKLRQQGSGGTEISTTNCQAVTSFKARLLAL